MQDDQDFDPRTGWPNIDCIAADAKAAGKSVRYDPDGTGFVQCDGLEDEGEP